MFTSDSSADGSFMSLKYNSADVILEGSNAIPTNHMYFLNTDYLGLDVHTDGNFSAQEGKSSVNQDATVVPILFSGNLTADNLSLQGVLKD